MTDLRTTCAETRERIWDWAAGKATLDQETRTHLERCQSCGLLAEEFQSLVRAKRKAAQGPLSVEVEQRVWRQLRSQLAVAQESVWSWRSWVNAAVAHWRWATAAAAVCALAIGVRVWMQPAPPTTVPDTWIAPFGNGVAVKVKGNAAWNAVAGNTPIAEGTTFSTATQARAEITAPNLRVVIASESTAEIARLNKQEIAFGLQRGEMHIEARKGAFKNRTLRINLPRVGLVVTGTVFSVKTQPDRDEVAVVEGAVRLVRARGADVFLGPGEHLVIEEAHHAESHLERRPPSPLEGEARLEDLLKDGNCDEAAKSLPPGNAIPKLKRGQAMAAVAECFSRAGEAEAALGWYVRLAKELQGTAIGEQAAYEKARILRKAKRELEATQAFEIYLHDYPRGALAPDAVYSLCALALDQGEGNKTLACAQTFRQRYPRDKRVGEIYLLEATALRVHKNDCRSAIVAYDHYLQTGGEYVEQARAWRAWCLKAVGGKTP